MTRDCPLSHKNQQMDTDRTDFALTPSDLGGIKNGTGWCTDPKSKLFKDCYIDIIWR